MNYYSENVQYSFINRLDPTKERKKNEKKIPANATGKQEIYIVGVKTCISTMEIGIEIPQKQKPEIQFNLVIPLYMSSRRS